MATAILKEIYEIDLIRTRDPKILSRLEIVYDVGGGEFDHHGVDKVYRVNGIPFAACGLIWNSFGRDVISIKNQLLDKDEVEMVFAYIDKFLIQGIDALDNGIRTDKEDIYVMDISTIISGFNTPWNSNDSQDVAFHRAVGVAGVVLRNTIEHRLSVLKAREKVVYAYKNRKRPEIIVLEQYCPYGETLIDIDDKGEVLFVVYKDGNNYTAQTVRDEDGEDRKKFPETWAGKRDEELAAATGVEDAVFCHTGRFITVAESFEGIMKLVQLALNDSMNR